VIGTLISIAISGLFIGALGRLAVPGPDPIGIGATILIGIVGSLLGALVAGLLYGSAVGDHVVVLLLLEVLGAAAIVYLVRVSRARRL